MSFPRVALLVLIALIGCTKEADVPKEIVAKAQELGDPLLTAIDENKPDAVAAALDDGADPNIPNKGDLPPLHLAASNGFVEVGELLIKRNAEIDRQPLREFDVEIDKTVKRPGETALHVAITSSQLDFVAMLIREKADLDLKNGRGMTPLDLANSRGRVLERAELEQKDHEMLVAISENIDANKKIVALLKEHGAKTTVELDEAKLKQAVKEDGTGGLLGRINEKMEKRRNQDLDPDEPIDLPDIDPIPKRDEGVYDLEFEDPTPEKEEDPDKIPDLFP